MTGMYRYVCMYVCIDTQHVECYNMYMYNRIKGQYFDAILKMFYTEYLWVLHHENNEEKFKKKGEKNPIEFTKLSGLELHKQMYVLLFYI